MATNIENDAVTTPPTTTDAEPPFDINAKADIILRSSDLVDFHVVKAFLIFTSPLFEGMFTLKQPLDGRSEGYKAGLAIIPMEEKSVTLRLLLLFCYPGNSPVLETLDDVLAVHAAASKYCMEEVEKRIRAALLSSPLMEQESLRIFAIAMRHRWEEVARAGAKNTLMVPVHKRPRVEELKFLSGLEYHQLQDYHWKCGDAASKVAKNFDGVLNDFRPDWVTRRGLGVFRPDMVTLLNQSDGHGNRSECSSVSITIAGLRYTTRQWWLDYMSEAGADLVIRPRGITVMEPAIVNKALERATSCAVCRKSVIPGMKEFIAMFAAEVERVISEVSTGELSLMECTNYVVINFGVHLDRVGSPILGCGHGMLCRQCGGTDGNVHVNRSYSFPETRWS